MEESNTCVYMHIKKTNGEAFYIGMGNPKRPYDKGGNRSNWWKKTANKYGYEVVILKEGISWSDACKIEIDLIKYFGRRDSGQGALVNMTDGGDGQKNPSAETRTKISVGNKGNTNMLGKSHSEESKAKISASKKGKKLSAEHIAKISAGNKGKKYSEETRAKMSKARRGEGTSTSILTEDKVIEILIELRDNPYYGQLTDLAKKYGISFGAVSGIKTNRNWKHICRESLP